MKTFRITLNTLSEIVNSVRQLLSNVVSFSLTKGIRKLENIPYVFIELLFIFGIFILLI